MDTGWTLDNRSPLSDQDMVLRSYKLWRFVLVFCRYFDFPLEDGFWIFVIEGTGLHMRGKW